MKLQRPLKNRSGFTLLELIIAMAMGVIVFFGLAFMMGDAQRSWNKLYHKAYSSVVADSFVARNTFDRMVRRSSGKKFLMGLTNDWIEVYYYNDINSVNTDRYGRMYLEGNNLVVEYGKVDPRETVDKITLCSSVSNCEFGATDGSVQLWLNLVDGDENISVMTSAIMQNN